MLTKLAFFLAGMAFTGLMLDRGINMPQKINDAIDWGALGELGEDIWKSKERSDGNGN